MGRHKRQKKELIKSVIVEDGVTEIARTDWIGFRDNRAEYQWYRVFDGCWRMTTISIPSSCVKIGSRGLARCNSLKITLPYSCVTIGVNALYCCTVEYPESTFDEESGEYTYRGGRAASIERRLIIKSVRVEEGVTTIEWGQFKGCTALVSIMIPDSCVDILGQAFNFCTALAILKIPETCVYIGIEALYGCTSLLTLKVPDRCQINSSALDGCTALEALANKTNLTIVKFCRSSKLLNFKFNLFASYNALNRLRLTDPLLVDPLIDKTSILWIMYDRITSDDVRRNIMEFLDYKWMGNK